MLKRRSIIIMLCLLLLPTLCLSSPLIGKTAPGFNLKSIENKAVSLKQLRAKGHVMLVFWSPECVYCLSHIKHLNELQKKYKNRLTVAAINFSGEHISDVKTYIGSYGPKYLFLADRIKNIDVAESYKVIGSPTIVIVSPKGRVLFYGYKIPTLTKWIKL